MPTSDKAPTERRAMTATETRQAFIDYFAGKPSPQNGHPLHPSSPVVPHDDPTLLFTNAGMNQFKPVFLEQVAPGSPLEGLARAANSQKCIRAGGKHNDLEDVGRDTYHHTFFEMLGNWSFGDYFKREAIDWAYEFLTEVLGLSPTRLYATYFGGDEDAGLAPDDEAKELWLKHLPPHRVIPGDMKDNFWEMGDTGPCGPCSEIHYDRVGDRDASSLVNQDDPDVLEVWNLVFIQFNRESATKLVPLPSKHVDTGMGLERLVSVLQDKRSNYDTDVFTPLFDAIQQATGARAYEPGVDGERLTDPVNVAYRVIADHLRTLSFAIADGAIPSNEGRGYVLRRVLRRAVRFGRQTLNAHTGFLSSLVPTLASQMGGFFPELAKNEARITEIIKDEEESFGRTLDRGIKHFEELAGNTQISGQDAFKLYDTFGFPLDLTELMASERGLTVDVDGFERCMEEQKERSRASSKFGSGEGTDLTLQPEHIASLHKLEIPTTDDSWKYCGRSTGAKVEAIWNGSDFDNTAKAANRTQHEIGVILDKTCFYAEMGGQIADRGKLLVTGDSPTRRDAASSGGALSYSEMRSGQRISTKAHGGLFRVTDVRSFGGYVLHIGHVSDGEICVGDVVQVDLDETRRGAIQANHTATHLLNLALRKFVSPDADQKGSLVADDRLRFDFAHNQPVTPEELAEVDALVRWKVDEAMPVYADLAPLEDAKKIGSLRAVFGETYPDPVRVVSVGAKIEDLLAKPEDPAWMERSVEFCGGTHVSNTEEIGAFTVISEEGIAKGVRRVTALTGVPAKAAIIAADTQEQEIADAHKLPDSELPAELTRLRTEIDELTMPAARKHDLRQKLVALEDRVKAAKKKAAGEAAKAAQAKAQSVAADAKASGARTVVARIDTGGDRKALQAAAGTISQTCEGVGVLLFSMDEPSVSVFASVPDEMAKALRAGDWIKAACEPMGGKGGGKPTQAQGGAPSGEKIEEALLAAKAFADAKLS